MNLYKSMGAAFAMDEASWRKHANPWSGWSRAAFGLPLLCLAIWSRAWIGWGALGVLAMVILWLWYNPRMFSAPQSYDAWMSRGVLGEKVFLEHRSEIAAHHRRAADLLAWMAAPGVCIMGIGLWQYWLDWVIFGAILGALPKFWFLDRMVWILQDWQNAGHEVWSNKT